MTFLFRWCSMLFRRRGRSKFKIHTQTWCEYMNIYSNWYIYTLTMFLYSMISLTCIFENLSSYQFVKLQYFHLFFEACLNHLMKILPQVKSCLLKSWNMSGIIKLTAWDKISSTTAPCTTKFPWWPGTWLILQAAKKDTRYAAFQVLHSYVVPLCQARCWHRSMI